MGKAVQTPGLGRETRCIFLAAIALTPLLVFALWNITEFPFGGTSLLITVGVALETMKQIDSQLMMRNYEGFLA
jgi:preprotein translocase subunit SecY